MAGSIRIVLIIVGCRFGFCDTVFSLNFNATVLDIKKLMFISVLDSEK